MFGGLFGQTADPGAAGGAGSVRNLFPSAQDKMNQFSLQPLSDKPGSRAKGANVPLH